MNNNANKDKPSWLAIPIVLPLLVAIIPLAVVLLALFIFACIGLRILIWSWWCLRRRDILFVYSDSPIWHNYIAKHILPYLGKRAVVLNWSQRKHWRFSLAKMAFHHFFGYREFNPIAVVFRPFGRTHTFRFWQPFREFKHGHPEALRKLETEFFGLIGVQRREPSA